MSNEPGRRPVLHTQKHVARLERERKQTRIILYSFFVILASVLLLLGYGFLDIKYLQLNKPVAKVGDVEIIEKDFEARVRLQRQQLMLNYNLYQQYAQFGMDTTQQIKQIEFSLGNPEFLGQSVLDQMINDELIRQEAAERGITISDEELDEFTKAQFRYFPDGTYTPTVTPTQVVPLENPAEAYQIVTRTPTVNPEFTQTATRVPTLESTTGTPAPTSTLEPTATMTVTFAATVTATIGPTATITPSATPYTLEGFQGEYDKSLKNFTKFGFTETSYRKLLEVELLQDKVKDVVTADVPGVEEKIWARHILVSDEGLAVSIIDRLNAGEDFGKLAAELSEDTGSAQNGGDLGWFGKGAMVAEFEAAAFTLKNPGDITPAPVKSQFGYHIIQLIAKQDQPLDATQYQQAKTTAFTDWLTKIREDYTIETFDFWKARVPLEPNFSTLATEAVEAAKTQNAEAANATATATP